MTSKIRIKLKLIFRKEREEKLIVVKQFDRIHLRLFSPCQTKIKISLHQIFLNEPTTEMGPVFATVIVEPATRFIVQPHLIASFQSQRGTQGSGNRITFS